MRCLFVVAVIVATGPARADDVPELPAIVGVKITATSTLTQKGKSFEPYYALGSDPTRFWCEGRPDEGLGEALLIEFAAPTKIDSLTIRAGVWRSPELFTASNRITQLDVTTENGTKQVKLNDARENVDVSVGRGPVSSVRLAIGAVAKGKNNDTCISGIDVHLDNGGTIALGVDAAAATALPGEIAKMWRAFADCNEAGFRAQLGFPVAFGDKASGKHFKDAKAVRKACKDGLFKEFSNIDRSLRVHFEGTGKLRVETDALEWHVALVGGKWKLVSLAAKGS